MPAACVRPRRQGPFHGMSPCRRAPQVPRMPATAHRGREDGRVARAGGKTELFAGEGLIEEKAAGPERGNDLRIEARVAVVEAGDDVEPIGRETRRLQVPLHPFYPDSRRPSQLPRLLEGFLRPVDSGHLETLACQKDGVSSAAAGKVQRRSILRQEISKCAQKRGGLRYPHCFIVRAIVQAIVPRLGCMCSVSPPGDRTIVGERTISPRSSNRDSGAAIPRVANHKTTGKDATASLRLGAFLCIRQKPPGVSNAIMRGNGPGSKEIVPSYL